MDINNKNISIKDKYKVKSIDTSQSKEWLLKKHYAKRLCSISYCFGLFDESNFLIGVCTFGKPASKDLCDGICGIENSKYVYELNRLCVNDNLERNTLSFFVSKSLKLIKESLIIVSYSDTSMHHHGYIYQATNFIYTGTTIERTDPEILGKHARHIKTDGSVTKRITRYSKHRYVIFIGNKKQKNIFFKYFKYNILPYPKGQNIRYDSSYNPSIQTTIF
jgi:hypothetical protein